MVGPAISSFLHFCDFLTPNGPACHCGRSRLLVPFPTYSHPVTSLCGNPPPLPPQHFLHYRKGPACHCGRSRLIPSPYPICTSLLPPTDPHSSLRSPHRSSQHLTISLPYPLLHSFTYRPGLSLWQVPPSTFFPLSYIQFTPPHRASPLLSLSPTTFTMARLTIVVGPVMSLSVHSFPPPAPH